MPSVAKVLAIIAPAIIVIVLAGWLAWALTRARVAEGEVERQREAATLAKAKFATAVQDAERLKAESDRLLSEDEGLRAELQRLQQTVGKVKVIRIREGAKEATAKGEPVPVPATGQEGSPACPACLVPPGSILLGRIREIDATTEKGNLVALARVTVERTSPGPRSTIYDEMLPAEGTLLSAPRARGEPRFQLGGAPWWTNPGWTAEIRGALRVTGPLWLQAAGRFDNQYSLGVMWSIY